MTSQFLRVAWLLAALTAAAGCAQSRAPWPSFGVGGTKLSHNGTSIDVPAGWDGRIGFLDGRGRYAIFQIADFDLPSWPDHGLLEPPPELPPGQEDPIKSMSGNQVLISVLAARPQATMKQRPSIQIGDGSFVPPDAPPTPRGHVLAEERGCLGGACLGVTVDFASRPVLPSLIRQVNQVLGSLTVEPEDSTS